MQIGRRFEVLQVGIDEVSEEKKQLEGNGFLQFLFKMRESRQILSWSQVANKFFILFFWIPLIVVVLFLVLV